MEANQKEAFNLVEKLDQNLANRDLYKVLVDLRTKYIDQNGHFLIKNGIISKIIQHLKRPNSKIVDVVLSILGNLLLESEARKQIKPHLRLVTSILTNLSEENILARTCRVLANAAQDFDNLRSMKGSLLVLVKTLNELKSSKAKASAVRAIRVFGAIEKKETLLNSNAIASVSSCLSMDDEELLKAVVKCLAKFTSHNCDPFMAMQIQGEGQGFQRLVNCCQHQNRSIWEPALTTLVNLSMLESLRPNLGNAGVIGILITKIHCEKLDDLTTVSALCLYCHESVNRMKIRDAGGLRLFVSILNKDEEAVKFKIIKSLLQFAYDDLSLKVLQHSGLVPALVKILDDYNGKNYHQHSCEEFICDLDSEKEDVDDPVEEESIVLENVLHQPEDQEQETVEPVEDEVSNQSCDTEQKEEIQYRINSPSYRQVQDEIEEFSKIKNYWSISSLSPTYSSRSGSASPIQPSCSSMCSSPMSGNEDRYSPIETFSDQEVDQEAPIIEAKKRKVKSNFFATYQPIYSYSSCTPMKKLRKSVSETSSIDKSRKNEMINIILQILSRLAQSEVPHEHLCDISTVKSLINYLCWTKRASKRAGRILLRLSKNLYCFMPFVNQKTFSWLKPQIEGRPTLSDSPCTDCTELSKFCKELLVNFSLLAETGYSEGVMCHKLVKGTLEDKENVSIAVPIVVRPRKLLVNILLNHEGLDVLLNIIEHQQQLFKEAVHSLSVLSAHIGIVSPNLKLLEVHEDMTKVCAYDESKEAKNLNIATDDGQTIQVNKDILTESSGVFQAMLAGQFVESSQSQVKIQQTGHNALTCLIHYLYGCKNCPVISKMTALTLLELASLTDKYLLLDLNQSVSIEIVKRCMRFDQVVDIYEASLIKEYPVRGTGENLNVCAISYLLVGQVDLETRTRVFEELIKSKMSSDFLIDINRTVRDKLEQ